MDTLIYILLIIIFYATANWVSLYSLALFVNPDEIETMYPHLSESRRKFLNNSVKHARAFIQVASVYKALSMIVITAFFVLLMQSVSVHLGLFKWIAWPAGLFLLWLGYVMIVEYLPRRSSRFGIHPRMAGRLWLIQFISFLVLPVVTTYRTAIKKGNIYDPLSEKEKEDIVERAIESLAEQSAIGESIVEKSEKEMISRVFLLDKKSVREIMVPRIEIKGIEKELTYQEIKDFIKQNSHARFPVYDKTIDKIVGVLHVKDIFDQMPEPGEAFDISKYLRKPYFVSENKVIGDLLTEFKQGMHHIAIAMDEHGGVAGLVTLENIVETLVGDIKDENVPEETEFASLPDGRFLVNATMRVEKLQDYLHTEYEQEDYETVGGLIYHLIGSVPRPGQKVKWHDLEFEIEKVDGRRIKFVRVAMSGHAALA
ncbi:MAG TPA: hemolysin family protein [candidate division Zixibacteria bacterium]|nr:hemolysin family protein [candidate division Zixibacteria bacterium]